MEFDINRVYTAVNADELKIGSKVIVADTIAELKEIISKSPVWGILKYVDDEHTMCRFNVGYGVFALCYLVSEPEEKKLKWTDLKIGDVIRRKGEIRMITGISTVRDSSEMHIFNGTNWLTDEELEEWEKVDYELEEYERRVEQ